METAWRPAEATNSEAVKPKKLVLQAFLDRATNGGNLIRHVRTAMKKGLLQ
jgi:hypothetical protein